MHGDHATRVALVPGAAGSAAFWTPITERLPDDWIVTAIDLPGLALFQHGMTSTAMTTWLSTSQESSRTKRRRGAIHGGICGAESGIAISPPRDAPRPRCGDKRHRCDEVRRRRLEIRLRRNISAGPILDPPQPSGSQRRSARARDSVLLIWPTADILSPLAVAETLAATIPTTSLITFPSDDHWVVHQFPSNPPRPFDRSSNNHYIRGELLDVEP